MSRYIKYPSTPFLPWARPDSDGKIIKSLDRLQGQRVIVTEKMDGENTTMYPTHIHARSLDSANHPSRDMVKNIWGSIRWMIPDEMRICGENMYATHSIHYDNLSSYFLVFSIWMDDVCLDWDDTIQWCSTFDTPLAPVMYDGIFDEKIIQDLWSEDMWDTTEGYVVRLADRFTLSEFPLSVAKFVRKNHVQTDEHWMRQEIVPNKLHR
jgi:hypothetical protein